MNTSKTGIAYVLMGGLLLGTVIWQLDRNAGEPDSIDLPDDPVDVVTTTIADRPIQVPVDGFVGSDACKSCHVRNHRTWHTSYHRSMTQLATP